MSESGQDASRLEPWIVEAPDAVMRAVGLTKSYTTGRGQLELFRELNEALGTSPWLFCAAESDSLASRYAEGARRSMQGRCKIIPGYPSFDPRWRK